MKTRYPCKKFSGLFIACSSCQWRYRSSSALNRLAFTQAFERPATIPVLKTARTRVIQLANPTTDKPIGKLCKWLK